MYEGGGAPLRGMWRWFENFNQFVSMRRGRACAGQTDRTWNDDHSLTPRVWQQGIWIEHVRHRLSPRIARCVKKCTAECRHLYCQEISPVRLFLPWRDQCDVLGITGLWDWVINKIIWTVIRLSCGPRSFRPHRLAREDQARKRQVTDERLDTKTRSWLCCYLCSVSLVTRIIYDKFPPLVSFCWN